MTGAPPRRPPAPPAAPAETATAPNPAARVRAKAKPASAEVPRTAPVRVRKGRGAPAAAKQAEAAKPADPLPQPKATRAGPPPSVYTREEADALFTRLAEALPEPETELAHVNPFTLLVAVVLSAQATDAGVNRATGPLFAVADTPQAMLELGEERIRDFIKTVGLFNTKAKNVLALSCAIVEEHGGAVPRDREALQALPGVGRKTANVVLNVAFGEPTIAVDTHVFRVGNRLGLAPGRTPDEVEEALHRIVPERYLMGAHHWLILHGRHVCKARRPLCEACVIYDLCKAEDRRPLPTAA